jgi:hypothetical protein
MGFQPVYNKGPRRLLCPGLRVTRGKITMTGIFNCLNYGENFIVYSYIHNYKCGRGPWIGDPRLASFQMMCPGRRLPVPFRNVSFYGGEEFGYLPNLHAGGPLLIGYPLLLTQYILSYASHLEAIFCIRNIRTRQAVVKGTHLPQSVCTYIYIYVCVHIYIYNMQ